MVSAGKNWTLQCWSVVVWMSWLMVAGWWGKMRAKANRKKSTFVFTIPPSLTNNTQLSSPQIRHIFLETGFKLHLSHLAWTKALVPVSLIFPFPFLVSSSPDRGQVEQVWSWSTLNYCRDSLAPAFNQHRWTLVSGQWPALILPHNNPISTLLLQQ